MKVIFIAGCYRGAGDNTVFEHIMLAREWARKAWLKGWAVFCPHTNTMFMDGPDIPAQVFLDGDREILRRCDAIFMLPNWRCSMGALAERQEAVNLGLPIYEQLEELPDERK
jgi:hypothetical protein